MNHIGSSHSSSSSHLNAQKKKLMWAKKNCSPRQYDSEGDEIREKLIKKSRCWLKHHCQTITEMFSLGYFVTLYPLMYPSVFFLLSYYFHLSFDGRVLSIILALLYGTVIRFENFCLLLHNFFFFLSFFSITKKNDLNTRRAWHIGCVWSRWRQ